MSTSAVDLARNNVQLGNNAVIIRGVGVSNNGNVVVLLNAIIDGVVIELNGANALSYSDSRLGNGVYLTNLSRGVNSSVNLAVAVVVDQLDGGSSDMRIDGSRLVNLSSQINQRSIRAGYEFYVFVGLCIGNNLSLVVLGAANGLLYLIGSAVQLNLLVAVLLESANITG